MFQMFNWINHRGRILLFNVNHNQPLLVINCVLFCWGRKTPHALKDEINHAKDFIWINTFILTPPKNNTTICFNLFR